MADDVTMKALRKLEAELDEHHKTLPFYAVGTGTSLYALLAMFDSILAIEPVLAPAGPEDVRTMQFKSSLEEGLSQALRWKIEREVLVDPAPTTDKEFMQLASDHIMFGGKFSNLTTFHVMLNKGWGDVSVDGERKIVRFLPSADHEAGKTMAGYDEGFVNGFPSHLSMISNPRFQSLMREVRRIIPSLRHELRDGRIVLQSLEELKHPAIVGLNNYFRTDFEYITPESDLGGFSIVEFQNYWSALARWSHCVSFLYLNHTFSGEPQANCMPTQCVPKEEFLQGIGMLSGLNSVTTAAITKRLSWGASKITPDIFLQPLIVGPKAVSWSTRIIDLSKYPRNMLRLMTKMGGSTKLLADDLIGNRELPAARRLGEFMAQKRRKGWAWKLGRFDIKAGGMVGQIDLLAWNSARPEEVLLIEYKASLETAEIHEMDAATILMLKGQEQLRKCVEILKRITVKDKQTLYPFVPWERVKKVYGIVVSSGCNPSEKYDHSEFPAVSLGAFLQRIPSAAFCRPSRLWEACRQREWLSHFDDAKSSHNEIQVGKLTYYIPALTYDADDKEGSLDSSDL